MHSRRKGKSSSKRPFKTENPEWVPLETVDVEETISKLASQGLSPSEIGIRLRDRYAVPNVRLAVGKSVTQILKQRGLKIEIPHDLGNLMKRAVKLQSYLKENPKDLQNRRGLELIEAKIRRLVRYYKRTGKIPKGWEYSAKMVELQVK